MGSVRYGERTQFHGERMDGITVSEAPQRDFHLADDVFIRHIVIAEAGSIVPQHAHRYDHTTFVAAGSLKAAADDRIIGVFSAPCGIFIKAGVKHTFYTLEPNTVLLCIHNAARPDVAAVIEENVPDISLLTGG